nr:BMP family ABC transporter substrate-binding protein [Candidatus Baldrarchaeota archaeon]
MKKVIIASIIFFLFLGSLTPVFSVPPIQTGVPVTPNIKETTPTLGNVKAGFETIKAGFVYVGPIGDYGWTHAHDQGRKIVDNKYNWLNTVYLESVPEAEASSAIENLINQGCNVIFTTSFGFMDATLEAAKQHPDIIFFHCSGYKRYKNMGTYFAEFYQLYYLNGLMAGALTKTGKAGYVAAYLIPEVVRHINAFALGFRETAKARGFDDPKVYVLEIGAWYNPDKAREFARVLIERYDCDALAFTEDSPAVIQYCQELFESKGKLVYAFAHYSPMLSYGRNVTLSGQLVHWEVIYEDILVKIHNGTYNTTNLENVDYWWMLGEGAVELGADFGVPINPIFEDDLKNVMVEDKLTGETVSAYELVMRRLNAMNKTEPEFEPFTGPIYANNGTLMVQEGVKLGHDELWDMQWFVQGVEMAKAAGIPIWVIGAIAGVVIVVVVVYFAMVKRKK